jgi:hypothetical protein
MIARRLLAGASLVAAAAALAYAAVGNGDIRASRDVTLITVTSPTTMDSDQLALENTTSATTYSVQVAPDATCDPGVGFAVSGGNPTTIGPMSARTVTITCPPRAGAAMQRCLLHATSTSNGAPLVDFMGLCLYGASPATLTPLTTSLDLGTVAVGNFSEQTLTLRNDGAQVLRRVYLQSTDLDGNFQFGSPCNPDAAYCDEELTAAVAPGETFDVVVRCRPRTAGNHTAEVHVGTDTFQLLALGVTLACEATAGGGPTLVAQPTTIEIPAPVEVTGGTANVVIRLTNAGTAGTLVVRDVRTIDIDAGAGDDWTYIASGECTGQITTMCSLSPGETVALDVTFDPSAIGNRRAGLLVSYRDTIDRTLEIPLEAIGRGATLRRLGHHPVLLGAVPIGRTTQHDITLVNDGNRDANVTLSLASGATPPFALMPASTVTVAPTVPRTVSVACTPAAAGTFMTTLTAQATDALTQSPVTVSVACEGTTQELFASPTAVLLGEVRVDQPVVRTVQLLSDDPTTPLTLSGQPQLEVASASVVLGTLSQQTTPATFDVTLMAPSEGQLATNIVVNTTTGETLRIPLSATITRPAFVTAMTFDLGTFCVAQPTTPSNVPLVSEGTASIELRAPELQQAPSPFDMLFTRPPAYPHHLASSEAAIVSVTPKRQQVAMTVTDTLTWHTDVSGRESVPTELTARFIDSGGAIAPPALNFGEVTVHLYTDNGQRVVIQNCNPTPLVLDPPMIRTPFSIDSPRFPAMLEPNERAAFSVGFHPTRIGPVMDTLRITSPQLPGAPLEVVLIGVGGTGGQGTPDAGLTPPPPEGGCCRSAHPVGHLVGLAPLSLVLVCVLRPRRRQQPRSRC